MLSLLTLSLCLCGQYYNSLPFKPLPPEIKDMAFSHAQEEWAYQCYSFKIYDWHNVMTTDDADLMEIIDSNTLSTRRHLLQRSEGSFSNRLTPDAGKHKRKRNGHQ